MRDGFDREIDYVRISVTDKCNLRCRYCMPDDIEHVEMKDILTFEEICDITRCMADAGICHVRLTGGEPLVRRGVCDLVRMLKGINGISDVTLTTNGILLRDNLEKLIDAGIDGINVSIDTLDAARYEYITGYDGLGQVTDGVNEALSAGIRVKLNAVSICIPDPATGQYKDPFEDASRLIEFARTRSADVRFIELMPIGFAKGFPSTGHDRLLEWFKKTYPAAAAENTDGNGPAAYYGIPGFTGRIGFISALDRCFCERCNRIRLTTKGFLKSCLCYDSGTDLRAIIRGGHNPEETRKKLYKAIEKAIKEKPRRHDFQNEDGITEKHAMSAIGG